jgi:hypothetical protein
MEGSVQRFKSKRAVNRILLFARKKAGWLHSAAKEMAAATERDCKKYAKS